jgi:ribosome modulation factor
MNARKQKVVDVGQMRLAQFRTAYMRGWDDCIRCRRRGDNPYRRRDYRDYWLTGYEACAAKNSLPKWYNEWVEKRRRR